MPQTIQFLICMILEMEPFSNGVGGIVTYENIPKGNIVVH